MAEATQTVSTKTVTPSLPGVPSQWPGAFGLYKYSKQAVKANLQTLLLLIVAEIVLGIVLNAIFKNAGQGLATLLDTFIMIAVYYTWFAGVRGQKKVEFQEVIRRSLNLEMFLKLFVLNILIGLTLLGCFLLFIIPFFIVLPRFILAPYYLVDKNMDIMDAYKTSWDNTKGQSGVIYGIIGANIAMVLLMFTIIGIPFAIYFLFMYSAAFTVYYDFHNKNIVPQVDQKTVAPTTKAA